MDADVVLSGGQVVTPAGTFEADVYIDSGKIRGISRPGNTVSAREHVDASGKLIFPGAVDPHVHIDGDNQLLSAATERYDTGTQAAALGGVTTIIDFGWQDPNATGSKSVVDGVKRKLDRAATDAYVDFSAHGVITSESTALEAELDRLLEVGITSVKVFTAYEFGLSYGFLDSLFSALADRDMVALVHTEEASVCQQRAEDNRDQNRVGVDGFLDSRPATAEAMAGDSAARLAIRNGCKYYQMHVSSQEALDALTVQRTRSPELIRGETCNSYVALTESVFEEQGFKALHAPPVRTAADQATIVEGLREGSLDVVSTDHSAYSLDGKDEEHWWDVPLGNNSLQNAFSVLYDELVRGRNFPPGLLADLMSHAPARLFGLPTKGGIVPGKDADLFLFDPDRELEIRADNNASTSDYTIYEGRHLRGCITDTFVRGERIVESGRIADNSPSGQFVSRTIPDWDQ